jgi:hypothetical protein
VGENILKEGLKKITKTEPMQRTREDKVDGPDGAVTLH